MRFQATNLAGAFLIEMQPIADDRGYFARAFCVAELENHGLNAKIVQSNVACSHRRGTLRGLHYQRAPDAECKLIRCTRGRIYNVIVDLRPESASHGQWFAAELTADNHALVYSPEGFANGYQTLTDDAEICYSTSRAYAPAAACGVRYNDPALGIRWPLDVSQISPQDQAWPDYDLSPSMRRATSSVGDGP